MNNQESIRTFIAIELSEDLIKGLSSLEDRLKSFASSSIKWIDPHSIHLTLKFLGQTPLHLVPSITSALDTICRTTRPFELSIAKLGSFPNLRQVQIVWVGVDGEIKGLNQLQQDIERAISPLGFPTEKRAFAPHLSLARVRDTATVAERQSLGDLLVRTSLTAPLNMIVSSVSLIQSQLTPRGSIYTTLHKSSLIPSCA